MSLSSYLNGLLARASAAIASPAPPSPRYSEDDIFALGRVFCDASKDNDDFSMSTSSLEPRRRPLAKSLEVPSSAPLSHSDNAIAPPSPQKDKERDLRKSQSVKEASAASRRGGHVGEFETFFQRLPWLTYRRDFEPLRDYRDPSSTTFTSDAGWGCMLRTGQMMLATTLVRHVYPGALENANDMIFRMILSWFNDHEDAPYSLHAIAHRGVALGKAIGKWFGPSTISAALRHLNKEHLECPVRILNAVSSMISTKEVMGLCRTDPASAKWTHGLLIMISCRLGLNGVNPIYLHSLKEYLKLPSSMGFVGGKPNASFYFVALQGNRVFYLDPHTTQPMALVSLEDAHGDLSSYFCPHIRSMDLSGIDESLALGFYIRDEQDWEVFVSEIRSLHARKEFHGLFDIDHDHHTAEVELNQHGDDFEMDDDVLDQPPIASRGFSSEKVERRGLRDELQNNGNEVKAVISKDDFDMDDFVNSDSEGNSVSEKGASKKEKAKEKERKKKEEKLKEKEKKEKEKLMHLQVRSQGKWKSVGVEMRDLKAKGSASEGDGDEDNDNDNDSFHKERLKDEEAEKLNEKAIEVQHTRNAPVTLAESVSQGFEFL